MNKNYKRIVSIGAHSLDAEIMGGPMMIKYAKNGSHCTFVHVTSGRLEKKDATEIEKKAYLKQIKRENLLAAEAMNCDFYAMGYASSNLPTNEKFIEIIMAYLTEEKVDCVITHNRGTLHPRHYYVYDTVTEAVRRLRKAGVAINLYYGENNEDLIGFIPTLYVSLTDEEEKMWFEGLKKYAIFNGKVNNMPYSEYYHAMGIVRACEAETNKKVKAYMHGALIDNE